jgi:hypothetical protein
LDILSFIGQSIVAPVSGLFVRVVEQISPEETRFQGVIIRTDGGFEIKMLYVNPDRSLIGTMVRAGDPVGTAQDMTVKAPAENGNPSIPNHVHIEVRGPNRVAIDPAPLLP